MILSPLNLPPRVKMKMIVNHHASKMIPKSKCHCCNLQPTILCVLSVSIYEQSSSSRKIGACDSWRSSPWKCFPSSSPRFELCVLLLATKLTTRGAKRVANTKMSLPFLGRKWSNHDCQYSCAWLLRCSLSFYIPLRRQNASSITILDRLQGLKFLFERRQLVLAIVTCPARLNITIPMFSCKFTRDQPSKITWKVSKPGSFKTPDTTATAYKGGCYKGANLFGMTWEPVLHLFPSFSHIHPGWSRERAGHQE